MHKKSQKEKTKLKTYQVTWEERHWVHITAKSPEEAEEKWRAGQFSPSKMDSEIISQPEAFLFRYRGCQCQTCTKY